ncbi:MAG: HAMP domain-containing histidine kinase [Deltaproteobacteria bacterium]|nr:HAMP domain-containing histidine kinase [Deltaproteobacteria bacterium]
MPAVATEDEVRSRLERLAALGARSSELAHELRNALAVLETSLHLVRKSLQKTDDYPRVEKQLARMAEQIHNGQALVREALDEVRGHGPERVEVDLRSLVLEIVGGVARPDHVALDVEVGSGKVTVDPRLMRQLLLNLVRNAVEALAARESGRVRVVARREGPHLLLVVEDDGPGIAADVAPRLFEAFNTSKANGTGLGLVVCRRIAEAHGGRIVARPAEPRGTSMEVTIPVS